MKYFAMAALTAALLAPVAVPSTASAELKCQKLGFAGLMAKCNREALPPLTLAAGKPLAEGPMQLSSGVYYTLEIISDGSQELAVAGADFFRAIWINEVVINDLEVRPLGIDSFEFDDEGVIEVKFIAIKPGRYELKVPGSKGESQRVDISIQ
ncbi:MAG: hypothetical protein AAGH68_12295 [Pseudomonadota bacterium]